jgi:hypothetical protein
MGSGIIQLVSYGYQDMFFVNNPTITFFKVIYKRHTNFAIESIPQFFNTKGDFGARVTSTIAKIGDLIGKIYLVVNLPPIGRFTDIVNEAGIGNSNISCCAWTQNIGYQLIKQIDLEIGGIIIDRHYSDWFNIYHEISTPISKKSGLNKMIGNVAELVELTYSKQGYLLNVPLIFWFNRYPNLALPLVASYNTDIKINIEFNSLDECLIIGPSHYIVISEDICLFEKGEILFQIVNNITNYFKFICFDPLLKRVYYIKVTPESIITTNLIKSQINSSYYVTPESSNSIEKLYFNKIKYFPQIINLALGTSYLLVDYVFLDFDERIRFAKNTHEYLVDVLTFDNDKILYHTNNKIKINYSLPCKEIIFRCVYNYLNSGYIKDKFNYTTNIVKNNDIISSVLLLMNGQERFSRQSNDYFSLIQPFLYHTATPPLGVYIYSFSINPEEFQPSGYSNFSKIDDIEINLVIDKNVSYNRPVYYRTYAVTMNILKFSNGLAGFIF